MNNHAHKATQILATATKNHLKCVTREAQVRYDKKLASVTFAIEHLELLINRVATELSILEAIQYLHETATKHGISGFESVFGYDPETFPNNLSTLRGTMKHIKNILRGDGVEGMIKRFDLNTRASIEARSGTLTIGKLLEIQPEIIILCLKES